MCLSGAIFKSTNTEGTGGVCLPPPGCSLPTANRESVTDAFTVGVYVCVCFDGDQGMGDGERCVFFLVSSVEPRKRLLFLCFFFFLIQSYPS